MQFQQNYKKQLKKLKHANGVLKVKAASIEKKVEEVEKELRQRKEKL